jgi:hypothetical protein
MRLRWAPGVEIILRRCGVGFVHAMAINEPAVDHPAVCAYGCTCRRVDFPSHTGACSLFLKVISSRARESSRVPQFGRRRRHRGLAAPSHGRPQDSPSLPCLALIPARAGVERAKVLVKSPVPESPSGPRKAPSTAASRGRMEVRQAKPEQPEPRVRPNVQSSPKEAIRPDHVDASAGLGKPPSE